MSYIYGPSKLPPKGWIVFDGQLVPDGSVDGYKARGREVKGVCHLRDCRRRCHLDIPRLSSQGFGSVQVRELTPTYRCHRIGGCALDFHEEYGHELTLDNLLGRDGVSIRVTCEKCRKARVVTVETLIARLKAEKSGDGSTTVAKLPSLVRSACGKCKVKAWRIDVLWYDPANLPGWLRDALGGPPPATP